MGWFQKLFHRDFVECECGGKIREEMNWNVWYYECNKCPKTMSEDEFIEKLRLQKTTNGQ